MIKCPKCGEEVFCDRFILCEDTFDSMEVAHEILAGIVGRKDLTVAMLAREVEMKLESLLKTAEK